MLKSGYAFLVPQLLTLYLGRAKHQNWTAIQIQPTLRVSSNTQTTLEHSPIQELGKLN